MKNLTTEVEVAEIEARPDPEERCCSCRTRKYILTCHACGHAVCEDCSKPCDEHEGKPTCPECAAPVFEYHLCMEAALVASIQIVRGER